MEKVLQVIKWVTFYMKMSKQHKNVSRCLMNQEPLDLTKDQLKLIFGNLRMILSMSKKKKIMHV
jgi:hypothetical protein